VWHAAEAGSDSVHTLGAQETKKENKRYDIRLMLNEYAEKCGTYNVWKLCTPELSVFYLSLWSVFWLFVTETVLLE
jgi:hypothetical protein